MSAQWEVQKAIYDLLYANSTFMDLISNRLYDEPPTNSDYPYVTIGDMTEIPNNRHMYNGYEVMANLHIYTKPAGLGFYSAKKIFEAMNAVLNVKRLTLTSLTGVICAYDNGITEREDDKRIMSVRYRCIAHSDTAISLT